MRKIHVGCGGEKFDGWENYDREVDISRPLPFQSESVDYMFSNHMLEHVTQQQGYRFLQECHRILKTGGVLRVGVPDIARILEMCSIPQVFNDYAIERGGSATIAVENVIFKFEHQSIYTAELLDAMLRAIGFKTILANRWDQSPFEEFSSALAVHHKDPIIWIETSVIDAWKR